jgi:molybdopterin synthase catalytic subunit
MDATLKDAPLSRARVQTAAFDVAQEITLLHGKEGRVGAICSFLGVVREVYAPENAKETLTALELEHYPGMTEQALEAMIDQALERFDIIAARIVHRVGVLKPLDPIVLVLVCAAHRGDSFKACEFLMDYLKTQAPFWKKEHTTVGTRWIDARESDDQALARWGHFAHNQAR